MRFISSLHVLAASLIACSSGQSDRPADDGGTDDGSSPISFTFAPTGCPYTVPIPATRGFTSIAPDDTSAPSGDITPERVRIGLGGGTVAGAAGYADPTTTAAFTWETAAQGNAAKVKLGTDAGTLSDVHTGFSWTDPPTSLIADKNPAFMHEVHVCGLKPGTTYYYQVGGGPAGTETWSATQSFTTVPAAGNKIIVGILGDARDKVATWQLAQGRMRDGMANIQLVSGDIVDVGGVESLYTQWLDAIWKDSSSPGKFLTLGQQMMVPIAGNHENEASQFYSNFAIPGDGAYAEQYASFDVGNTHFVLIDDQPLQQDGSDAGNAILAWLDTDLAAANGNRTKVPFIVTISHRGLYSTSNHSTDSDVLDVRGKLAPLYDKYSVDLVFNGHDHEYERSKPLHAGTPPTGAPVVGAGTQYVICAGAGADPYAVGTAAIDYREKNTPFGNGTPYVGVYSLLTLEANKLTLNAYGIKASSVTVAGDDVIDTLQLTH